MPPTRVNECILMTMESRLPCARRPNSALKFGQVVKVENALSGMRSQEVDLVGMRASRLYTT